MAAAVAIGARASRTATFHPGRRPRRPGAEIICSRPSARPCRRRRVRPAASRVAVPGPGEADAVGGLDVDRLARVGVVGREREAPARRDQDPGPELDHRHQGHREQTGQQAGDGNEGRRGRQAHGSPFGTGGGRGGSEAVEVSIGSEAGDGPAEPDGPAIPGPPDGDAAAGDEVEGVPTGGPPLARDDQRGPGPIIQPGRVRRLTAVMGSEQGVDRRGRLRDQLQQADSFEVARQQEPPPGRLDGQDDAPLVVLRPGPDGRGRQEDGQRHVAAEGPAIPLGDRPDGDSQGADAVEQHPRVLRRLPPLRPGGTRTAPMGNRSRRSGSPS